MTKILSLLVESGKSQKELCDFIEVPPSVFSDWKSGKSKSVKQYIDRIAEFFGCTVDYLLGASQGNEATLSPNELRLIRNYRALSDSSKKFTQKTIEATRYYEENQTMLVLIAARGGDPPGVVEISVSDAERLKRLPGKEQDGPI